MGNITGALIENAFQPQPGDEPSIDVQEEIKNITCDSSNRELYRLLHAKMEHGSAERTVMKRSTTPNSADGNCDSSGTTDKVELAMRRTSGDETLALTGSGCSSNSLKIIADQNEQRSLPRMNFKKKILNSYRCESEDVGGKAETSSVADCAEQNVAKAAASQNIARGDSPKSRPGSSGATASKPVKKMLNIDSCIEVIVMSELQKLDGMPDDSLGSKKLPFFGTLGMDSLKSSAGETVQRDGGLARGLADLGVMRGPEPTSRAAESDFRRDKLPYGHLDAAPAGPDVMPHRSASRKSEPGQTMHGAPPTASYRPGLSEIPQVQDLPKKYGHVNENVLVSRNPRMMFSQAGESHGSGEVGLPHGPAGKYVPAGVWNHSHDVAPTQPSPHVLNAESGYRPSPNMMMPMADHRRKPEKESADMMKYPPRQEFMPFSAGPQYPVISGLPPQHGVYPTNHPPPILVDKHHHADNASYGYPPKPTREIVHAQFEPPFGNQCDGLQPPTVGYLKHSPKNSPVVAYEKDTLRPSMAETRYTRSDLLKSGAGDISAGLPPRSTYRMTVEPQPQVAYHFEKQARPEIPLDKRNISGPMIANEEFEFDRRMRFGPSNQRDLSSVPVVPEQPLPRAGSRGREAVMEKVGSGVTEETPLDLTVRKDMSDSHLSASNYLPHPMPGLKHQSEWEIGRSAAYKALGVREEELPRTYRPGSQKGPEFAIPELQRKETLDPRYAYEKLPQNLQPLGSEYDFARVSTSLAQERNSRTSVIASHPFDDSATSLGPAPHLTMHQLTEALVKTSMHPVGNWKASGYPDMIARNPAYPVEPEPVLRRQERPRPRPSNSSNDLSHLTATSPTIPLLSPVPHLATAATPQPSGRSRVQAPSLIGSHSPSDILHLQCKVCGSMYGSLRSFRMHFAKAHGLEPLPEHCNVSTISGAKSAMSKAVAVEDCEPPALQRETLPSEVALSEKSRVYPYEQFPNVPRSVKPDSARIEVQPPNTRMKQVAEVYPMLARASCGLSPQMKLDAVISSVRQPDITSLPTDQNDDGQMKPTGDFKTSHMVTCDLGIIRSRNCYDVGCDRDSDCPECLDGFKDISDWKMHISTHMMRSCTCKVCNQSFTHSGALKKHLNTVHSPMEKVDVEYRCLFCRESFSDEKVLFFHTQEHEKRYSRVDNARRDSCSSVGYRQPPGAGDSEGIQMAIPDTTCSDDVRPTSDFGESSSNVSPGVESRGSAHERKSFSDLLSAHLERDVTGRRLDDAKSEDARKLKKEAEQECKPWTVHVHSDGSGQDFVSGKGRSDFGLSGIKFSDGESQTRLKVEAKYSFEITEAGKESKPSKPSDESNAFVSKKRALLKRFQSTEESVSAGSDSPSQLAGSGRMDHSTGSGGSVSGSKSGGGTGKENLEAPQPLHLRDLLSMMGRQVETSVRAMPDFSPMSNIAPMLRTRCVRDVCDEIIAQSFREEKNPREPPLTGSLLESLELNLKVKEQLKTLIGNDQESPTETPQPRPTPDVGLSRSRGWARSPCSSRDSRDSYHSLEIDESKFDKESSCKDAEGSQLDSMDSEKHCSFVGSGKSSPKQDIDCKESGELREGIGYAAKPETHVQTGNPSCQGRDEEVTGGQTEYSFGRPNARDGAAREDHSPPKESCSPSSTQKSEAGIENISLDQVRTPGCRKRKRSSSDTSSSKDTSDVNDELLQPPAKQSLAS